MNNSLGIAAYRRVWEQWFPSKWILGLVLILLFGVPRFLIVLQSNVTGNSQWISIIFTVMCFTPLFFLKKTGRRIIGLRASSKPQWLVWGFLLGGVFCFLLFAMFWLIYKQEPSNAFVYIGNNTSSGDSGLAYVLIYLAILMTFSPMGEELFYRGVIHECFRQRFGESGASMIDSLAFALTHLAHFGIVYHHESWKFLLIPALLWIASMFLICMIFNKIKRMSGSILGAILTHAGFNLAMGMIIIYLI